MSVLRMLKIYGRNAKRAIVSAIGVDIENPPRIACESGY